MIGLVQDVRETSILPLYLHFSHLPGQPNGLFFLFIWLLKHHRHKNLVIFSQGENENSDRSFLCPQDNFVVLHGIDAAIRNFLTCRSLKSRADIQVKVKAFVNYPRAAIILDERYAYSVLSWFYFPRFFKVPNIVATSANRETTGG